MADCPRHLRLPKIVKTILDKTFLMPVSGADGIRVLVSEHQDSPGEYIVSLERGGMKDPICSLDELRFVSGAIAAAATRIEDAT